MKNKKLLLLLPVIIGAAAGFAYYYFIGCTSGTCPIKSNAYLMTGYGAGMGLLVTLAFFKK
jgi:hypothetical protein